MIVIIIIVIIIIIIIIIIIMIIIVIIITIIIVDIFTYLYKFHLFKGWEQGVIGMKKGGKRLIAIPSSLAYGEKVCGQHIAKLCGLFRKSLKKFIRLVKLILI